jgi:hypothetical protein
MHQMQRVVVDDAKVVQVVAVAAYPCVEGQPFTVHDVGSWNELPVKAELT